MSGALIQPTLAGFELFLRNRARIDVVYLPAADPMIEEAYNASLDTVVTALTVVRGGVYAQAVYSLGTSVLINWAADQDGRTFFSELRERLGIEKFQAGVVAGTSDASTSVNFATPDFMTQLTLMDLQNLKDPFGRAYLAIAQQYGPQIVGLS